VSDGKDQPMRGELRIELPAGYRRLNHRDPSLRVNRDLTQSPEIDQQAPVAKRKPYPAMPSATHRDFHSVRASKPNRLNNVMLARNLHDQLWVARRCQLIPDDLAPEIFVPGISPGR
jgi:hypothetical protein